MKKLGIRKDHGLLVGLGTLLTTYVIQENSEYFAEYEKELPFRINTIYDDTVRLFSQLGILERVVNVTNHVLENTGIEFLSEYLSDNLHSVRPRYTVWTYLRGKMDEKDLQKSIYNALYRISRIKSNRSGI